MNVGGETFTYRVTKAGVVRVFWEDRCVLTLGGERGELLTARLKTADPETVQALLQRATGNFKRGNERRTTRRG